MPLILLLVRITVCMCTNRDLFRRTVLKKCGRDRQLFFGLWLMSEEFQHPQSKPKKCSPLADFFIKCASH